MDFYNILSGAESCAESKYGLIMIVSHRSLYLLQNMKFGFTWKYFTALQEIKNMHKLYNAIFYQEFVERCQTLHLKPLRASGGREKQEVA